MIVEVSWLLSLPQPHFNTLRHMCVYIYIYIYAHSLIHTNSDLGND